MMERLAKFLSGPKIEDVQSEIGGDIAWAESRMYGSNIEKYNPDELIGRKGYKVYRKMMIDEQVKAVVKFKRDAITSRDSMFVFEDTAELSDTEQERRIDIYNTMLKKVSGSYTDGLNYIMTAMYQGFSITEKKFDVFDYMGVPYVGIRKLSPKPYDTFKFKVDEYGNIEKVIQDLDGKVQDIDLRRFVYYVHNPEFDQHYGQSDLREAYRSWYSKDVGVRFYNQFLERLAGGVIVAKPTEGSVLKAGSADYNAVKAAIENISNTTAMLLPSNITLEIHDPKSTDQFEKHIVMHDLQIAKALLVPNLLGISHVGETGSFAQSQTQLEAFLWTLDADALRLSDVLNEQVFDLLAKINFADGIGPKFRFKPVSEEMKLKIVAAWQALVTAGAVEATDTDETYLRELMDFPEKGEPIKKAAPPMLPGQPPIGKPGEEDEDDEVMPDETITGEERRIVSSAAFTLALKRVSFQVISRKSQDLEKTHTANIESKLADLVADMVVTIEEDKLGTPAGSIEAIAKLDFKNKAKAKRAIDAALKEAWRLGYKHSQDEINKAHKENMKLNMARIDEEAAAFLAANGFRMLGNLTDDMRQIVHTILMNGVKYSWTTRAMIEKIYDSLTQAGFVTMETNRVATGRIASDVEQALQGALGNASRVATAVRTNTFEAINEARYAAFTDPVVSDFIEALEYSAILDDRTTDICTHLDGRIYPANSPEWDSIRPPNHYNCRSLLIPVTVIDTEAVGKDAPKGERWSRPSTKEPQKGFGGTNG